jgi:DNA topoisomerase-1
MPLDCHVDGPVLARAAGLTYVNDHDPGIRRTPSGKGFTYHQPSGAAIHDEATLGRIRALAIPPAYIDVWICPDPDGHIQATGRDARGRKQYRYHAQWRAHQDEDKYDRMAAFGRALPRLRQTVEADLARHGLPREKVLAAVVRLLELTLIRVGNDEYARKNKSFGLTTLRKRHVDVHGSGVMFEFRGKSGKDHRTGIQDRRLANVVKACQELRGQRLFQYRGDDGHLHAVSSDDVNTYMHDDTGEHFTAKDFRTWAGTLLAAQLLAACEKASCESASKRLVNCPEPILKVIEVADPDVCLCARQYSLVDHANAVNQLFPAVKAKGVSLVIGSSLNEGFISGSPRYNYGAENNNIPAEAIAKRDKLRVIADRYGVDLRTAALQFSAAAEAGVALIVGAASADQVMQNFNSMQAKIPQEFWAELRSEKLIEPGARTPG